MSVKVAVVEQIKVRFELLKPFLGERQRRLWAGAEAEAIKHGGVAAVSRATGMSVNTVRSGREELRAMPLVAADPLQGYQRQPGAGRPMLEERDPGLLEALLALVEPQTRGEPDSALRWSSKSTVKLAEELTAKGHPVGPTTVGRLLTQEGFSLQATRKTREGGNHPDRDAQFRAINEQAKQMNEQGQPVISIDAKKKELVGDFFNKGREWQPAKEPEEVNVYDFPGRAKAKAVPYGVYDVFRNEGWVRVGISADTAEFAANTVQSWWEKMGCERYTQATELLITADCGGSNSYRSRLWRLELQQLADATNLTIRVMHYPPGTSKWNRIEHRMFNHITMNWRGRPLTSLEVVVNCIANTRTEAGLRIGAELDENVYERGIKVTDAQLEQVRIIRDEFHGEWNYRILPKTEPKTIS